MKKLLFAAALAVLIIVPSCKNRRNNTEVDNTDSTAVEEPVVPLQEDRTLDDAARILAGLPVAEDSPVAYWMEKEVWKTHRAEMDDLWKICRETLTKIDTFAVKDIKDINDKAKQVFYPFSGPDFPYAATFFPKPTTYWFMALEKTGSIPSLNGMSENTFGMYRNAMRTHLKSSYFITNAMDNDLANEVIDGTIPIMMVLIARMDFHIASIAYKNLEEDGTLTDSDKPTDVVEIKYFNREENVLRSVYYFYANLRDNYFKKSTQALIDRLDPAITVGYVKSCSYCLHKPHFSQIREDMTAHCFAIVQDDTGVPYRYFTPDKWDVTLYGGYTHPLAAFESYTYQLDLVEAYKSPDVKPLNFKHGYMKICSLIVARNK